MNEEFELIHNHHEEAVFQAVTEQASRLPRLADSPELRADVACIALNRLPVRYIRNAIDMSFFMDSQDRARSEAAIHAAVTFAIQLVISRHSQATVPIK